MVPDFHRSRSSSSTYSHLQPFEQPRCWRFERLQCRVATTRSDVCSTDEGQVRLNAISELARTLKPGRTEFAEENQRCVERWRTGENLVVAKGASATTCV